MRKKELMTLVAATALLVAVTGCDVTTEPKSTVTDATVYTDTKTYEAFLAKLYGGLVVTGQQGPAGQADFSNLDEGFTQYTRQLWQLEELPTDEAVIAWNDAGLPELSQMTWGSDNQFVEMMYERVFFQVSLINEFLRETTDAKLESRGQSDIIDEIHEYRAEARFLRALSYWHGIDLFGDIPLVTEADEIGATPPQQSTRGEIFNFIVDELTQIRNDLPAPGFADYGRADQGALMMLLAKLYMNAGVYTGSDMYGLALGEIEDLIASGAYQLAGDYWLNFGADNDASPEIIFPVPQDGLHTQTYGNTTFLAHAGCGGNEMDPADYGLNGCWWGLRVTPEFVELFPGAVDNAGVSPDGRENFFVTGQNLEVASITNFNDGWAAPKYDNVTSLGMQGSHDNFPDTDYPMFRLADAYLMYAECVLRGAGGSQATALDYVNQLRERAYGDASGDITADQLTLDFVLAERGRELWWEGHRRTDLIRYGVFTSGDMLWSWKGGTQAGSQAADKYELYPIPARECLSNPNLTGTPGCSY